MKCETCDNDGQACEQCGRVQCMSCYRRYSWQATSRLCSTCQYEADKEWTDAVCSGKRNVVMRKWPRGGTP